jgi:hypothetical protein
MIILREITWLKELRGNLELGPEQKKHLLDFGWGNGYVIIKKDHQLWGSDYNSVSVNVHGGITFANSVHHFYMMVNGEKEPKLKEQLENLPLKYKGGWMFGFDTVHYGDSLEKWPHRRVRLEAEKLQKQLENYGN